MTPQTSTPNTTPTPNPTPTSYPPTPPTAPLPPLQNTPPPTQTPHPPINPTTNTTTTTTTTPPANHSPPLTTLPSSHHASPSHKPRPRSHSHTDAVLPRGSLVRITGNNRTKWDLIGRTGLVRAAQTLGGWHEVQLTDGALVRVQRNALEVLERAAPEPGAVVRIDARRDIPVALDKPGAAPIKKKKKKRDAFAVGGRTFANLGKLNIASLKRYLNVYDLEVGEDCSRDELVGAVKSHFEKTKVNETEVISNFLRHIARRGGPAASD